jgi:FKBP-type peptidyl-prolyl cis-trans isomerase FklB
VKRHSILVAALIAALCTAAVAQDAAVESTAPAPAVDPLALSADGVLRTDQDRLSYSLGVLLARQLGADGVDLKVDIFTMGFKDAFSDAETLISDEMVVQIVQTYQQQRMAEQRQVYEKMAEENAKQGKAFLEENKTKPGVFTTESGLQYMIITQGDGPKPAADDLVLVNYSGKLLDGTVFADSFSEGEPEPLEITRLIAGWGEALQMMPVGSRYRIFVPSELAYGEYGRTPNIGPNSTLVFELELLGIEKPEEAADAVAPAAPVEEPQAAPEEE